MIFYSVHLEAQENCVTQNHYTYPTFIRRKRLLQYMFTFLIAYNFRGVYLCNIICLYILAYTTVTQLCWSGQAAACLIVFLPTSKPAGSQSQRRKLIHFVILYLSTYVFSLGQELKAKRGDEEGGKFVG
jgi:hypothetical protein